MSDPRDYERGRRRHSHPARATSADRWWGRLLRLRGILAVGAATLVLGAGAGAAPAVADDERPDGDVPTQGGRF